MRRRKMLRWMGVENLESRQMLAADFGDAPLPYPVTLADGGPQHQAVGPMLGATRTMEADGTTLLTANGDDGDDGVQFNELRVGQQDAMIVVDVQDAPAGAFVDAWIDFNGDGTWAGHNEHVLKNVAVVDGANQLLIDVPADANSGDTFARVRLSTVGNHSTTSTAIDGEVEDYVVSVLPPTATNAGFIDHSISAVTVGGGQYYFGAITSGDFDNDGDVDVVVSLDNGSAQDVNLAWFENQNGGESFVQRDIDANLPLLQEVIAVDVDSDGDLDLVAAIEGDDEVAWYENDGTGGFTRQTVAAGISAPIGVAAGDIDNDGDVDLFSVNHYSGNLRIHENTGNGQFNTSIISTPLTLARHVEVADMDRDGDLDIITFEQNPRRTTIHQNFGQGQFATQIFEEGEMAGAVRDLDADGDIDIVTRTRSIIGEIINQGNGTYTNTLNDIGFSLYGWATEVLAVDIDGDNVPEILTPVSTTPGHPLVDTRFTIYERTTNGLAESSQINGIGFVATAADIDGDGDLDLFGADPNGMLVWQENVTVNVLPTIAPIEDVNLVFNSAEETIELVGISPGINETQALRVSAASSDPAVIADPVVVYSDGDSVAQLSLTPQAGQRGIATITVTLEDPGFDGDFATISDNGIRTESFNVTVSSFGPNLSQTGDYPTVISELLVDPLFGANVLDTHQLLEFRGAPDTQLSDNTYFVVVDEQNFSRGEIREVFDLSGLSFGSNGYLVLTQEGSTHVVAAEANHIQSTAVGFTGLPDSRYSSLDTDGHIGDVLVGANGYFLIESDVPPTVGADIDTDDDGLAEIGGVRADWRILDSVSLHPFVAAGDQGYGQILISEPSTGNDPNLRTVEPGVSIVTVDGGGYVARLGESVGSEPEAWISGTAVNIDTDRSGPLLELYGFGPELPLPYRLLERPLDNFGEANFFGGVRGTMQLLPALGDIDPNQPTPDPVPLVGVQVLADENGNGVRDVFVRNADPNVITDPIAATLPTFPDIPLTHAFPGLTLSTADDLNKPYDFEVRGVREGQNVFQQQNFIYSHAGVNFFNESRKLRADFDHPVSEVSIDVIGSGSGTTPAYGRLEIYDKNDNLLGVTISPPLLRTTRTTLSLASTQDDIAYAVAYSDESLNPSSPFGKFDSLTYRQSEVVAFTDETGRYEIANLSPGQYEIVVNGVTDLSLLGIQSQPVQIDKYEHFVIGSSLRPNTAPVMDAEFAFSVNENAVVGTAIGMIVASDPDSQNLVFSIEGENEFGLVIDSQTGELSVGPSSSLNFEAVNAFTLNVAATDGFAARTAVVTVDVLDRNEAPIVSSSDFRIAEGTAGGTVIGEVDAIDPDFSLGQTLTYSIIGGRDAGDFVIDPTSGLVSLSDSITADFETRRELRFIVRVSDNASPSLSTDVEQIVTVIDQNDPPQFVTTQIDVAENSQGVIGTVVATDADAGQTLTYQLTNAGSSPFSISSSGVVSIRSGFTLDFETQSTYALSVVVLDNGTPAIAENATITVNVTDVNEPPALEQESVEIAEDAAVGSVVTVLATQDPEGGQANYVITLLESDDSAEFDFNSDTNEVTVAAGANLDYETDASKSLRFRISDSEGIEPSNEVVLTIAIRDANDAPTIRANRLVVSELAVAGTPVGRVSVSDPDSGDVLSVEISGGRDADLFVLDSDTQMLAVAAGASFDAESSSGPLLVEVTVTDEDGLSATATIEILVNDVNEPPVITQTPPASTSMQSGELFSFTLPPDAVVDPESSSVELAVFAQSGELPEWLDFDPATGVLIGLATPQSVGSYQLILRAFEKGPLSLRSDYSFAINVEAGELPLTNKRDPLDVDANGRIAAIDALRVVNYITRFGRSLPISTQQAFNGFVDTSGDGSVTALDALLIINALSSQSSEGEQWLPGQIGDDDSDLVADQALAAYLSESSLF
ncbi:cadherin domain-containing protein [Rubripirellula amarantea]|nr:cadherin domain-containing protein [Rubripirellula amarantea]